MTSDTSYPTIISHEISKSVLNMLRHLKRCPPNEIYGNIDIMIKTLEGKPFDETMEEVGHSSPETVINPENNSKNEAEKNE